MNYYEAKFERAAKERPSDWIIKSVGNGFFLAFIGEPGGNE